MYVQYVCKKIYTILNVCMLLLFYFFFLLTSSPHLCCPLQAGMTAPGTRRLIFDKKLNLESCDSSTVSLQMGTNKVASQRGMTSYGQPRQVCDNKYCNIPTEEDPYNDQGAEFDGYNQYSE